jgi:hypothetical protein
MVGFLHYSQILHQAETAARYKRSSLFDLLSSDKKSFIMLVVPGGELVALVIMYKTFFLCC